MKTKYETWVKKVWNSRIPAYFRVELIHASRRRGESSTQSYYYDYSYVGESLAKTAESYVEYEEFEQLLDVFDKPDLVKKYLNEYYSLIPYKRRNIFLRGFIQCLAEEYLLPRTHKTKINIK